MLWLDYTITSTTNDDEKNMSMNSEHLLSTSTNSSLTQVELEILEKKIQQNEKHPWDDLI